MDENWIRISLDSAQKYKDDKTYWTGLLIDPHPQAKIQRWLLRDLLGLFETQWIIGVSKVNEKWE